MYTYSSVVHKSKKYIRSKRKTQMVYIVFRKNKTKDKLHKKNKTKKRESERRERYNIKKMRGIK